MKYLYLVFLILLAVTGSSTAQNDITTGPIKGQLLLIGGNAEDSLYLPMFMDLAGGPDASVVIIPSARSEQVISQNFSDQQVQRFQQFGFKNVSILHTRCKKKANTEAFVDPLKNADAVWIMGGRQWRLVDAYQNTLTHLELVGLLHRGGVIAGTSAGATIQGSYLVRGDTEKNTIMMGDHEKSFSFIKNCAVDQHLLARNRHFDLFEVLQEHPELLGIGLDENTGILVDGDTFRVVGESYVAIYDGTRWSEERDTIYELKDQEHQFYFLKAGDRYNMKLRSVILDE